MAIEESARTDAAMDEAARAICAGAPSAALRANVLRQITAPAPRAPAWRPLAAAAAALVIVAASVVWQWTGRPNGSHPDRPAAIDLAPEPSPADGAPRAAAAPVAPRQAAPDRGASRARGRIARQSPGPAGVPSTVDIAPLAIAPVSPEEIEVDAVTALSGVDVAPIAIRPLAIVQIAGDQVE